jgi:ATP-dependent helicase IRC3
MPLKPYQTAALQSVEQRKVQRGIIAIPTGTGKGHIAGELKDSLKTDRILYLAHRKELIRQLTEHVERVMGWGYVGVERECERAGDHCRTVIASVPTLVMNNCRRLQRFSPDKFDAIVCDEAHHSIADSYLSIWRYFGLLNEKNKKTVNPRISLIGLTATPSRGDNVGLSNVYDEILYQMSLFEAIEQGWLVPVFPYTIKTGTSLDNVRTRMGEYVERELAQAVDTEARNEEVFDAYQKNAKGLKALIFCVNVQHSADIAACFSAKGVPAEYISGDMKDEKRDGIFNWFAKTPGAVLTNCQLVTEGVDIPSVECVVMAKPTKSKTLYAQCLGRGTRLAKGAWDFTESVKLGKSGCILLDITDSIRDAGRRAVTVGDIFGAPLPTKPLAGVDMNKEVKTQQRAVEEARQGNYKPLGTLSGTEAIAVELFAMPANLPGSDMAWLDYGDSFRLPIAKHGDITIESDTLDRWSALFYDKENHRTDSIFKDVPDQAKIIQLVENWVKSKCSSSLTLVNKSANWRKLEPTPGQVGLCHKLRIEIPAGASRGDVSMAIDRKMTQLNSKRRAASGVF